VYQVNPTIGTDLPLKACEISEVICAFFELEKNAAFEAIFCLLSAAVFYFLDYHSMFALSVVFLLVLVPVRAIRSYSMRNKGVSNE
jgi:hypothetical protein